METKNFKKIYVWVLTSLTVINLAMLITIGYYMIFKKPEKPHGPDDFYKYRYCECPAKCDSVTFHKYINFKHNYQKKTSSLTDSLKELRFKIIDELQKENPDTVLLNKLAENSGEIYAQIRKKTIHQLMLMKDSFPPEFRGNFYRTCGRNDFKNQKINREPLKRKINKNRMNNHRLNDFDKQQQNKNKPK